MEIGITWNNQLVRNFDFSKKEKNEIKSLDQWIGQVKRSDKRLYKILVFTVASMSYSATVLADTGEALNNIDKIGYIFLSIFQKVGYWGCLLGCFVEILKSLMNTATKDIWKIFMKYMVIFAILYLLPWAFDLIKETFSSF